jgi:alkylation response protein AidB-like acyl-CoA dehydrogenase
MAIPLAKSVKGTASTTAHAQKYSDRTYRIFGTKIFITYGEHNMAETIVHLVLGRVEKAPRISKALACLLYRSF